MVLLECYRLQVMLLLWLRFMLFVDYFDDRFITLAILVEWRLLGA